MYKLKAVVFYKFYNAEATYKERGKHRSQRIAEASSFGRYHSAISRPATKDHLLAGGKGTPHGALQPYCSVLTKPDLIAYRTSPAVSWMLSFFIRFMRWVLTVLGLKKSLRAISRLVNP